LDGSDRRLSWTWPREREGILSVGGKRYKRASERLYVGLGFGFVSEHDNQRRERDIWLGQYHISFIVTVSVYEIRKGFSKAERRDEIAGMAAIGCGRVRINNARLWAFWCRQ
jgi:hypothetical protein